MSSKFLNIHKKTLVLESLFKKAAVGRAAFSLKKRALQNLYMNILRYEYSNIANFLRTSLHVNYTFPKFYVMREFFGRLWVQN